MIFPINTMESREIVTTKIINGFKVVFKTTIKNGGIETKQSQVFKNGVYQYSGSSEFYTAQNQITEFYMTQY